MTTTHPHAIAGMPPVLDAFWQRFLAIADDPADASGRFYEAFRVGAAAAEANVGASLIASGAKTATSSLLGSYEAESRPPPEVGALSIVQNGRDEPVCVIESMRVEVAAFGALTEEFARDYGETDGTLAGWYQAFRPWYAAECEALGATLDEHTPLVCEWFRVVYRESEQR